MNRMATDTNFTALVKPAKGGNPAERYVFVWHDDQRQELLRTFGRFASNQELSYSWSDAANMSHEIHKQEKRR